MKLDAPERDVHDDQVLSVALAAWWGEQSPETRQCWLVVWAIHDLWLLASMGAHDAESASGPLDFDLGKEDRLRIFAAYNTEGCATMRIA